VRLNNRKTTTGMEIQWNPVDPEAWDAFHAQHLGSLQQSWAYGNAMKALGVRVHRAWVWDGSRPLALAQFVGRKVLGYLSVASCSRGPVWSAELSADERRHWMRQMQRALPQPPLRVVLWSPDQAGEALQPGEVAGFSRVMTGYSTAYIDLSRPAAALRESMDGNWRNRLVKAESQTELRVTVEPNMPLCRWLLEREGEQRERRGFHGLPTGFVETYIAAFSKRPQAFAVASAKSGGQTIAAMLFLRHGSAASYHIGWSNEEGRRLNAHNLLLWRGMEYLRSQGLRVLDLGGLNTRDLAGISRFKIGSGGQVVTLAGTYFRP